ncbi:Cyclic nucleotide phosphodiesterase [Ceraceosorus bombacis]|uniref:Cyclic nucleotide phosphodiesterase n=1 Tax=Ceraceosorus bombacis TaxID=401625 RepID=A0A0P1BDF6_9BASI|nr:Cyclic nucleotide phosphodiesterase [Ceraceosorus bombacis]
MTPGSSTSNADLLSAPARSSHTSSHTDGSPGLSASSGSNSSSDGTTTPAKNRARQTSKTSRSRSVDVGEAITPGRVSESARTAPSSPASGTPSVGRTLQNTYKALQLRARRSLLDLRVGGSGSARRHEGLHGATRHLHPHARDASLHPLSARTASQGFGTSESKLGRRAGDIDGSLGSLVTPTAARPSVAEERRGSGGTVKGSRWGIRPSSRPSSSGSGAASSTQGSSPWSNRRRRERDESSRQSAALHTSSLAGYGASPDVGDYADALAMGPSPSTQSRLLPPLDVDGRDARALQGFPAGPSNGLGSLASFSFPHDAAFLRTRAQPLQGMDGGMRHPGPTDTKSASVKWLSNSPTTPLASHFTHCRPSVIGHAHQSSGTNAERRRASENPPCTCPAVLPRRHSELPVLVPSHLSPSPSRSILEQPSAASPALSRRRSVRPSAARNRLVTQMASWDFCSLDLSDEDMRSACEIVFEAVLCAPIPRNVLDQPPVLHDATTSAQTSTSTSESPLTTLGEHLGVTMDAVRRVLDSIMDLYHSSNAYHNFNHAADVLQALYALLVDLKAVPSLSPNSTAAWDPASSPLSPQDALALLFAAIGHDAGHPGLSNAYLSNASAPIAIAFRCGAPEHGNAEKGKSKDEVGSDDSLVKPAKGSPLESYHAILFEGLMERCGLAHLLWAEPGARSEFGEVIRSCILATDMAIHSSFVSALSTFEARLYDEPVVSDRRDRAQKIRAQPRSERTLLCAALLKCADISNPVRARSVGRRWSVALRKEWERQSALEEECGLPVTAGAANKCKHKRRSAAPVSMPPLPGSPSANEDGLRRTSAAQMVAQIGGGGGAAAEIVEVSLNDLAAAGELEEERALARGQVAFVNAFVAPLMVAIAKLLPSLDTYLQLAIDNKALWEKHLEAVEARILAEGPSKPSSPPGNPSMTALSIADEQLAQLHGRPAISLSMLDSERLRLPSIFLPPVDKVPLDAQSCREQVQRAIDDALIGAVRAWKVPVPEGVTADHPFIAIDVADANKSSTAAMPDAADDRQRCASSASLASSIRSAASSTPATAHSTSTAATSSASGVLGLGKVDLHWSALKSQLTAPSSRHEDLSVGLAPALPPITASTSSLERPTSSLYDVQVPSSAPSPGHASQSRRKTPISVMRRLSAWSTSK